MLGSCLNRYVFKRAGAVPILVGCNCWFFCIVDGKPSILEHRCSELEDLIIAQLNLFNIFFSACLIHSGSVCPDGLLENLPGSCRKLGKRAEMGNQ